MPTKESRKRKPASVPTTLTEEQRQRAICMVGGMFRVALEDPNFNDLIYEKMTGKKRVRTQLADHVADSLKKTKFAL